MPSPHADTVAPTLELTGRERVTITDYKTSDVSDPVKARQRARESLQLQIYAMAYQAQTGTLAQKGEGWIVTTEQFCSFMALARTPCAA